MTSGRCIVYNCQNTRRKNKDCTFHRLPLNKKRKSLLKKWVLALRMVNPPINKYSTICSLHFEPSCFKEFGNFGRVTLKADAVPTLHMTDGFAQSDEFRKKRNRSISHAAVQTEPQPQDSEVSTSGKKDKSDKSPKKKTQLVVHSDHDSNNPEQSTLQTKVQLEANKESLSPKKSHNDDDADNVESLDAKDCEASTSGENGNKSKHKKRNLDDDDDDVESPSSKKRKHDDEDYVASSDSEVEDLDDEYEPSDSDGSSTRHKRSELDADVDVGDEGKSEKYIVYEEQLMKLIRCQEPKCTAPVIDIEKNLVGSMLSITGSCLKNHKFKWSSQPRCGGVTGRPAGNICMTAAAVFSGNTFTTLNQICTLMNVASIKKSVFYNIKRDILEPSIKEMEDEESDDEDDENA
ncbi:uncharacterized protein [Antedon mediterranea]|uniref:uncharacterized protein isoform X2 n=1 Tax=Antedon mediterranea TaxID=105859 RepID=UPI003AF95E7B